jgi:hypothetical protein
MNQLAPITAAHTPSLLAASDASASYRFLEFFTTADQEPAHPPRLCARGDGILRLACELARLGGVKDRRFAAPQEPRPSDR